LGNARPAEALASIIIRRASAFVGSAKAVRMHRPISVIASSARALVCGVWFFVVRENSFLCEVAGCRLAGNAEGGLLLRRLKKGRAGDYISNTVRNCLVYGGGCGIECDNAVVVNLLGCTVYQSGKTAFYLHDDTNSVLINECRTFQITGSAVRAVRSHELNVSGNIFCGHTEHGIVIEECSWGAIVGNNVNYYSEAGVVRGGEGSCEARNVCHGEEPYISTSDYPWCQSFQPHLTREFIERQL